MPNFSTWIQTQECSSGKQLKINNLHEFSSNQIARHKSDMATTEKTMKTRQDYDNKTKRVHIPLLTLIL